MAVGLYFFGTYDDIMAQLLDSCMNMLIDAVHPIVIDNFATNKLVKHLHDCEVVKYRPFEDGRDNWADIYAYAEQLLREHKIDKLIVFRNVLVEHFHKGDCYQGRYMNSVIEEGKSRCFKFASAKKLASKLCLVKAAGVVCDTVFQYIQDPQEMCYDEVLKFNRFKVLHSVVKFDYTFMPLYEPGCIAAANPASKESDFVFYCGAVTADREYIARIADKLEAIPDWDIGIFRRGGKGKKCSQSEYYRKLECSRYTLVIPSYDKTTFSTCRFVEAIARDCLCFVHKNVCLQDVQNTFPNIYNIIIKYLIVDNFKMVRQTINEWSEEKRQSILDEIKNTKEWKRFSDAEYTKERWRRLLAKY